jgi:hypothetical protein
MVEILVSTERADRLVQLFLAAGDDWQRFPFTAS